MNKPKNTNNPQSQVQIIGRPPVFAVDGNTLFITDQGYGDLTFIQIVNREGDNIQAQGVASIRLSYDQLRALSETITHTLKQQEEKMSKLAQKGEKKETELKG